MSLFDDPDYQALAAAYTEGVAEYEKSCDKFWNELDYDDKLMAFYSVVKRIHEGEVVKKGSYRYVLYDVFGFGMDAYGIGMECGFMDLHNRIDTEDYKATFNPDGSIQC